VIAIYSTPREDNFNKVFTSAVIKEARPYILYGQYSIYIALHIAMLHPA